MFGQSHSPFSHLYAVGVAVILAGARSETATVSFRSQAGKPIKRSQRTSSLVHEIAAEWPACTTVPSYGRASPDPAPTSGAVSWGAALIPQKGARVSCPRGVLPACASEVCSETCSAACFRGSAVFYVTSVGCSARLRMGSSAYAGTCFYAGCCSCEPSIFLRYAMAPSSRRRCSRRSGSANGHVRLLQAVSSGWTDMISPRWSTIATR